MMEQQSSLPLLKKLPLPPHPPQHDKRRIIQIKEEQLLLFLADAPQPQSLLQHPVAAKSLMAFCLLCFAFDSYYVEAARPDT